MITRNLHIRYLLSLVLKAAIPWPLAFSLSLNNDTDNLECVLLLAPRMVKGCEGQRYDGKLKEFIFTRKSKTDMWFKPCLKSRSRFFWFSHTGNFHSTSVFQPSRTLFESVIQINSVDVTESRYFRVKYRGLFFEIASVEKLKWRMPAWWPNTYLDYPNRCNDLPFYEVCPNSLQCSHFLIERL